MTNREEERDEEPARVVIPRVLDLGLADDRVTFLEACLHLPKLHELALESLGDYVRWFVAPEWRTVHSGGIVSGPYAKGTRQATGSTIEHMLRTTTMLRGLQHCKGFDRVLASLNNPTQVNSVMFEVEAATWCATRAVHRELVFSPPVQRTSGVKYPDFLWQTALGDLYCECKRANLWQRREVRRLTALADVLVQAMGDKGAWPDTLRIDVLIEGSLGRNPDKRLRAAVRGLSDAGRRGAHPAAVLDGSITATLRQRKDAPIMPGDAVTINQILVDSDRPVRMDAHSAHLTITRDLAATRARLLGGLVREAQMQLPQDGPGAVFVDMPGADASANRLRGMLAHPAHKNVVWTCVSTADQMLWAVWRDDQPFDGRLLRAHDAPA
ncbi:MAG: hypothetical protein E6J14_15305 [Chloroflexi bacterium]|nr:MAG: hypothetical protein E6J14_15305 [Chloroflexota bacterium]